MVVFPNGKINLGLHITGKRADGYHNLETIFYPINLKDALEIIPSHAASENALISFSSTGIPISGIKEDNLCYKAFALLKKDYPQIGALFMHLHKNIPMGAGLGGGSSDGAFTIKLINQIFQLQLTNQAMENYALALGSDCPFFIQNIPCFATGRGEHLLPISLNLNAYQMLLVYPSIHIATAWAFSQIQPRKPDTSLEEIIQGPISNWKHQLVNDFEIPVIHQHPIIGKIKQEMYAQKAIYASLSGSGSTVYGIFEKSAPIRLNAFEMGATYLI